MKQIRILAAVVLIFAFSLTSCESFFDVNFDDQATLEKTFSQSSTTKKFLSHLYSYIPMEEEIVNSHGWVVPRSDEGQYSFYQWVYYLLYKTGSYSSATPNSTTYYNYWPEFYIGINQCSIFINNVDLNKGDSAEVNAYMKAEARFLRAYFYFCLFRQYGPVYIWGDKESDEAILASSIDRHTVEENISFIVTELDKAAADLPLQVADLGENEATWTGRLTKGAALALKSRVLLYAASPLYNGCDLYVGKMKNMYGNYLFPQTKDESKWEDAAKAAWAVIEMGRYELCKDNTTGDKFKDGMTSYQKVMFDPWNKETIWGWWWRTNQAAYAYLGTVGGQIGPALPPMGTTFYASYGGIAPSLKLVDNYPMYESGRYPITGYQGQNDMSKPIIDPLSGYSNVGFTDNYQQPLDANIGWTPAPIKAHNSCVGRDPRFYACVVPNGFWWPNKTMNVKFTCYNNAECTSRWSAAGSCIRVGYAWRRLLSANMSLARQEDFKAIRYVYPAFRLAEIYLNYAEACNEKPQRDEAAAIEYLNKVRNRSGLNNIEDAYPEIKGNKNLLRWCIQKERMAEFGLEAMRHYDACRWMIAKDEYPGANWTLHVSATTYEESYERTSTDFAGAPNTFQDKDYLFPISANQLAEMTNMTQNYGF